MIELLFGCSGVIEHGLDKLGGLGKMLQALIYGFSCDDLIVSLAFSDRQLFN